MWKQLDDEMNNRLNVHDCVPGKVIDNSKERVFVQLENGETAFAYFNRLERGTSVLCTVLKPSRGWVLMNVSIDSVYGVDRGEACVQSAAA